MLPFSQIRLTARKTTGYGWRGEFTTLGEHIKDRRISLRHDQETTGQHLGVCGETIYNWENNKSEPAIKHYPKIMEYLTYCPIQKTNTGGGSLTLYRTHKGLTIRELANMIKADPNTISKWERGEREPNQKQRTLLKEILGY